MCRSCWSNEWMLVADARDSGRLLLVEMEVFDRERRMLLAIVGARRALGLRSVYTPNKAPRTTMGAGGVR